MKILAISGSLRAASLNSALVRGIEALAPDDVTFTIYEGMADLPHYNPEIDTDSPPDSVRDLRDRLAWADAALICTPEYAHGMPGSLKNLLDWTVSSADFDGKPVAALSASPSHEGGLHAHAWLVQTLIVLGAKIPAEASLRIPFARTKIDADGDITDPALAQATRRTFAALQEVVGAGS